MLLHSGSCIPVPAISFLVTCDTLPFIGSGAEACVPQAGCTACVSVLHDGCSVFV